MNYYEVKDDKIYKYNVKCDELELKRIRDEIVNNCSLITHEEVIASRVYCNDKSVVVKNLIKSHQVGVCGQTDGPDYPVYRFTYDAYHVPKLVELIDKLLNNDEKVLKLIFDYQAEDNKLEDKLTLLSEKIDRVSNLEVQNKKKLLDKMEKLLTIVELNVNQESTKDYYDKLLKLIKMDFVDSISIKKVSDVVYFFDNRVDAYIHEEGVIKKKILKDTK